MSNPMMEMMQGMMGGGGMNQMMSQMMGNMAKQNPMAGMLMQMMQGSKSKADVRQKMVNWVHNNPNDPNSKKLADALAQTSQMSDQDLMNYAQQVMTGGK